MFMHQGTLLKLPNSYNQIVVKLSNLLESDFVYFAIHCIHVKLHNENENGWIALSEKTPYFAHMTLKAKIQYGVEVFYVAPMITVQNLPFAPKLIEFLITFICMKHFKYMVGFGGWYILLCHLLNGIHLK